VETIAVYWENRAKTYGFQVERELSRFRISTDPRELAGLGSVLFNDAGAMRFNWVLVQASSRHLLKICLLLSREWAPSMQVLVRQLRENNIDLDIQTTSPVELVYFHGPHFGDRYGIADMALGTLRRKGLPILAAGCTGASVYIVVPEQRSAEVKQILSDVFDTPHG
jgi:aspartokinase